MSIERERAVEAFVKGFRSLAHALEWYDALGESEKRETRNRCYKTCGGPAKEYFERVKREEAK